MFRTIQSLATLWLVATAVFALTHIIGNPVLQLLPPDHTQADYDRLAHSLGYDRPIAIQYLDLLRGLVHGDFGISAIYSAPALAIVGPRIPVTATLACLASVGALVIGVPIGIAAGYWPGSVIDRMSVAVAVIGQAVPGFVVGILLIFGLAVQLKWLPVIGSMDPAGLTMPVISLALWAVAAIIRLARSGTRETMSQPFVVLARAKGLSEMRVIRDHVIRHALLPVVTFGALQFGVLMSGAAVIESVFAIPGLGKLALDAVLQRDTNLIQCAVILVAASFIVVNLVGDLLRGALDPRVRLYG